MGVGGQSIASTTLLLGKLPCNHYAWSWVALGAKMDGSQKKISSY